MESTVTSATRHRGPLSVPQLVACALAAVTATVAASYLGVSATLVGAAVGSVVTVVGSAAYSHFLQRGGRAISLPMLALACAMVFVAVLLLVTALEIVAGAPLTDVLHGRYGAGTTVFGSLGRSAVSAVVSAMPRP